MFSKKLISSNNKRRKQMFSWTLYETLESTGEMKLMMKFYLCLPNFSELWNLFSITISGDYFISSALRNVKRTVKYWKLFWYPDFCPLKTEIARLSIGFRLKLFGVTRARRRAAPFWIYQSSADYLNRLFKPQANQWEQCPTMCKT